MTYPTITDLPPAPQRTQTPDAFATTADTFVAALPDLVTEVNTAGAYIDTKTISVGNDFQGDYSAGTTYTTGQSVLSVGLFYLSLVDSNTGNTPASSPSQWVQISGNVGAAGGGVVEFTADGTITAGDLVSLQSDGTVAPVAETASATPVVGGTGEASGNNPQQLVSVFDSTNNKVAYIYRNTSNGYPMGLVGTVSGTTISFGAETTIVSGNYFPEGIAYDSNADRIVTWFKDNSLDNMYIRTTSITGTNMSNEGNALVTTSAASSNSCAAVFDSTNNKTVVVGEQGAPSTVAWVIEVSGATVTVNTGVTIISQNWEEVALGFDSTNSKVVIFGRNAANNQYYASVGTVSGTTTSWGSAVSVTSNTISDTDVAFDSNAGKFLLCYKDSNNSNYLYGVVGTVSGTSISFGTPAVIASVGFNYTQVEFNPDQNKFCVTWRDSTSLTGKAVFVTLSGTSFTTSSVTEITAGQYVIPTTHDNLIYDTNSDKFVTSYRDTDSDAAATVIATTSTNVADWVGVAADSISDTGSGNINIIGGVNEEQTGLTPNTVIYAQSDGSLSSTVSNYKVGRAIASDKVLITEGNA